MDNQLLKVALNRRSTRRYGQKKIEDEVLQEIMKVALAAPSSFGHNPVSFYVVRDKKLIEKMASCKSRGGKQIIGANAVIAVTVETKDLNRSEFWIEDGSVASAYLVLAAEQYNVGACWVQIRNRNGEKKTSDEEIRELLGISDGYTILNLVALGEKLEQGYPHKEVDLNLQRIQWIG